MFLTHQAIPIDAICVPESQKAAYVAANLGTKIVTHPDSVKGIGLKRQWIYDKWGDVFMVDDDLKSFVRTYLPKYRSRVKYSRMTPEEAYDAVHVLYQMAIQFNAYLFAFAITGDVRNYSPQKPFKFNVPVNGAAMGMRAGSKLFFHPESTAANDMFVSGLNAYFHRYAFVDTRFSFIQEATFAFPGGLSGIRSQGTEVEDKGFLERMFGNAIKVRGGNRRRLGPAKSAGNRSLIIPF